MADSIPSGSRGPRDRSKARVRYQADAKLLENVFLEEQQSHQESPLLKSCPPLLTPPPPPPPPTWARQPVPNIPAPPPLPPQFQQPVPNIPAPPPLPHRVRQLPNIPSPPPLPRRARPARRARRAQQPVPNIPVPPPLPPLAQQPVLNIPAPPPPPPPYPGNLFRNRFRTGFIAPPQPFHDLEANILDPIEPVPIGNFFDRIRFIRNLVLIPNPNPNLLDPPIFIVDVFDRIRVLVRTFFKYLVKRTEEFRPEEGPHEMEPRFLKFTSNSTRKNDRLWSFFKWVYVINMWLMVLCLFAGVCYWKFGEGSSNPKSFRFKDESMISPVLAVGFVSSIVYWCYVYHHWNELYLFKIRSYHIGFLAMDVVCDVRFGKALGLSYYGFHDPAKYGCWTDILVVGFPVFFSMASLSILTLFKKEFYHADGLINDFIIIFVSPSVIQFAHHSYINGVLYMIPIVFGRLSKIVGFIYRPHVTDDYYDPTTTTGN